MLSIAPTADDTTPTPSLLSVAPSFKDQADATINFIKDKAAHSSDHLKVIPFSKSGDAYGRTIAETFSQEIQGQGIDSLPSHVYTTPDDLVQAVKSIGGLSMLYLAGSPDEASQLQAILRQEHISLQILGPADMYQWVYQNYTSEEMRDLVGLQFTAFAYHDASTMHDRTSPECIVSGSNPSTPQYDMLKDYSQDFSSGGVYFGSAYTRKIPSSDAVLAYDAVSLMETAGINAGNSLSTQALWTALQTFTPTHPFPGLSGQISFQEDKTAPYKKVVLLITITKQGDSIGNTIMPVADTSATVWEGCYQFAPN